MVSQFPQTEYIAKDNLSSISYKFRWHILLILSICLLLVSMDATILHAVMPTIILDLKPSNLQQLWIINTFITLGAFSFFHRFNVSLCI